MVTTAVETTGFIFTMVPTTVGPGRPRQQNKNFMCQMSLSAQASTGRVNIQFSPDVHNQALPSHRFHQQSLHSFKRVEMLKKDMSKTAVLTFVRIYWL